MTVRVFISSVQKELEPERIALFSLLTTDPSLKDYIEPVLFEHLSPSPRPTKKPYLKTLKSCQVYIPMLDREYAMSYRRRGHESIDNLSTIRGKLSIVDITEKGNNKHRVHNILCHIDHN